MMYPPCFKYIKTKFWKEYCGHWDSLFQIGGQFVQEESQQLQNQTNANIAIKN